MRHAVLILFIGLFYSCSKDNVDTTPYFSFDNSAKEWFSNLKVNDTLKFLSNTGNKRVYRVINIESKKEQIQDCNWTTGHCKVYFYYDDRTIYFERTDSAYSATQIRIYMFPPDNLDYKKLPANVIPQPKMFGDFDDYNGTPLSNGGRISLKFPDIYQPVIFSTFTTSAKTYNEVIIFNSNNPNPFVSSSSNKAFNVNEVWYDRKFGFVYFKDIYGQTWTRQN